MAVRAPSSRNAGGLLFLACLLVYVATAGGSLATTDGVVAYELTDSLLHGSLSIRPGILDIEAVRGPDGRSYSAFGIAQSIYNIPFYLAGTAIQRVSGVRLGKPDTLPKAAVAMGGAVASAAAVWLTYLLAAYISGSTSGGLAAALILAFATSVWPYSKFGFNAPLTMVLLAAGTYAVLVGTREERPAMLMGAGACFGAALLTRHEMALAAAAPAAFLLLESWGNRPALAARLKRFLPPVLLAVLFSLAYNYVRFRNPFETGHLRDSVPGFGSSPLAGLSGLLFSPAASLFLYSPPAIAGAIALARLRRRDVNAALLLAGPVLLLLLLYSTMGNWIAGRSYGPRYLVPFLPLLCAPLALWPERRGKRWLAVLAVAGVLVQLPGVLVDFAKVGVNFARQTDRRAAETPYDWETAPLVLNAKASFAAVPANVRFLVGIEEPPVLASTGAASDRDFSQRLSFSLDLWWLYLFYLGAVPAPIALLLGIVPLVAASVLLARLTQIAQRTSQPSARGVL